MLDQDKSKQELIAELAEMRRREAQWRSIVSNTPLFVAIVDRTGTIQYLNHTAAGHTLEAALGKSAYEFIEPAYREIARECIERVFDTGQAGFYEPVAAGPNGSFSWYETHVGPVKVGDQVVAVTLVSIDITERKRAEEALQKAHDELEQRVRERTAELAKANENLDIFRKFMDASGVGFGMADLDGTIAYANLVLCRLMGEEKLEDMVGKNISGYYPADYLQRRRDEMIPALLREEYWHTETQVLRRHAEPISAQQSTFLIRDEKGSPFRTAVVISDITERKRAHDALEQERQSLWRMLQASDHERQILSYEIHDGLAQYLAAAAMQFQAYDSLKKNLPAEAAKAYETAVELVRQAHAESRRLINDVRPPMIDEIGIETAISHLVHEQRKRGGPKMQFDSDVQFEKLPSIFENALYRIAQEALTNACKHSRSQKVMVSLVQEGQDVRLEVRDWGIGFDSGLVKEGHFGLEGIRQRVRLLGGRLAIESGPDSGTLTGTLIRVVVPILEK